MLETEYQFLFPGDGTERHVNWVIRLYPGYTGNLTARGIENVLFCSAYRQMYGACLKYSRTLLSNS